MKKMNKKGFTLIEMLAVIAIIAVLVAIIVPAVGSSTTKAKASTDAANLRSVLSAATIEYASNGLNDDDKLELTIDVPAAKSVTASDIVVVMIGDEMDAYYTASGKYYSIDAFAAVAEGAKDDKDKTITKVAELANLPADAEIVYTTVAEVEGD